LVEAAEKIGIGRDTLSELERGRRHPVMPTLSKIARGYGVQVEELLDLEEEEVPQEALSEESVHRGKAEAWPAAPPSSEIVVWLAAPPPSSETGLLQGETYVESAVLEALFSYVEQRIKMYEEELKDPNSPPLSIVDLLLLAELLEEQGELLARSMINEGRERAALSLVERAKQYIEELAEVSERAQARFADKHSPLDKAAQQSFARAGEGLLDMALIAEAALQLPPYETYKLDWAPSAVARRGRTTAQALWGRGEGPEE